MKVICMLVMRVLKAALVITASISSPQLLRV
jgi:hypothetical protein